MQITVPGRPVLKGGAGQQVRPLPIAGLRQGFRLFQQAGEFPREAPEIPAVEQSGSEQGGKDGGGDPQALHPTASFATK